MRPDLETALEHLTAVRRRLAAADPGARAVRDLEDALGDAAAHALAADAWLLRVDQQLRDLAADGRADGQALRLAAGDRERIAAGLLALRRELATLRGEHARLRGRDSGVPSA